MDVQGPGGRRPHAEPARRSGARAVAAPHAALRALVIGGYSGFVEAAVPRRFVLPATTSVAVVFKIHDSAYRPAAFVMGAHPRHIVLDGDGPLSYLELWLTPLGAQELLGVPVDELRGRAVDVGELLGATGHEHVDQIREASNWDRRFAIVDQLLLGRLAAGNRPPAPEVRRAWHRLVSSGGTVPIGRLADEVGWSHKHLITGFRRHVGLAPKAAARVVRFRRVLRSLDGAPAWERIAAEAGYTDQSHLVRDFHELAGTTPTGFLRWGQQRGRDGGHMKMPAPA